MVVSYRGYCGHSAVHPVKFTSRYPSCSLPQPGLRLPRPGYRRHPAWSASGQGAGAAHLLHQQGYLFFAAKGILRPVDDHCLRVLVPVQVPQRAAQHGINQVCGLIRRVAAGITSRSCSSGFNSACPTKATGRVPAGSRSFSSSAVLISKRSSYCQRSRLYRIVCQGDQFHRPASPPPARHK